MTRCKDRRGRRTVRDGGGSTVIEVITTHECGAYDAGSGRGVRGL